jgi:hypothetical protein
MCLDSRRQGLAGALRKGVGAAALGFNVESRALRGTSRRKGNPCLFKQPNVPAQDGVVWRPCGWCSH